MIEIHNKIGKDIVCKIEYKGEEVGICENILSLYDVLCQIKQEQKDGYELIVESTDKNNNTIRCNVSITKDGKILKKNIPNALTWTDIFDRQLLFLSGYTNNVIYEKRKLI